MSIYRQLNRPIIITEYDPRWPALFEAEKDRLALALGASVLQFEHIGSTSVPGLAAKPVIDIAIGLKHLEQAAVCIPILETLGYHYAPELEADLPGRRFLWAGTPLEHTYHLHVAEVASPLWVGPMTFRDYLRGQPEAACEYARLKRALAQQCGSEIGAYVAGKTEFVERILRQAQMDSVGLNAKRALPPESYHVSAVRIALGRMRRKT